MEFEHELELQQHGLTVDKLPLSIRTTIKNWTGRRNKTTPEDADGQRWLQARSIAIADDIRAFAEKDLPDEETNNPNNMPTPEEIKAAEDKAAADKAAADAAAADKAAADTAAATAAKEPAEKEAKEKADKEAADAAEAAATAAKEPADKEAKEKADKEAADKEAAEKRAAEDDDDLVDGLM